MYGTPERRNAAFCLTEHLRGRADKDMFEEITQPSSGSEYYVLMLFICALTISPIHGKKKKS